MNQNSSTKAITIRDVARLAGVSISTASLTFKKSPRVNVDTARRVIEAAEQIGYRPNPIAQSLRRGHSPAVGMLVGDIASAFAGRLLKATEKQAWASGYLMIVADSDGDPDRELAVLDQLVAQKVGGLILSPHGTGAAYDKKLRELKTPMVMVDHRHPGSGHDYVGSDSNLAMAMITRHLLGLGHRRIAHISGPPQLYTAAQRIQGFRETLHAAGIEPAESLIVNGRFSQIEAHDQTLRLLRQADRPTAIIAASNMMALGALMAIQSLGLECPREISLATIDALPGQEVIHPKITMVEQDVERMAFISAGYLIERMNPTNSVIDPRETILIPKLIIGNSTSAPLFN